LAARPETLARDIVLGRPAVVTGLAYPGFFPNGLSHDLSAEAPVTPAGTPSRHLHQVVAFSAETSAQNACFGQFLP
jgi:hypothetical protein